MTRDAGLRHWNPRRFFGRQRFRCDCEPRSSPGDGTVWHSSTCRTQWANWTRRERLRRWLLHVIPVGGTKSFEADGTHQQRPMTAQEHMDAIFAEDGEDESELTRFERFQLRAQRMSVSFTWRPAAPAWRHLGARLSLLIWEGVVRFRRLLLWLAPFVATAYIVLDLMRK